MEAKPFTALLDEARWRASHWKLFAIISLNYMLDGVMFSVAPVLAYLLAPDIALLVLAANLLSETAGALILGRLADLYGRRLMFMVSLGIEALAIIALFFLHENPIAFLVLTSLMTFGVGGEFGAAYSAIAELSPRRFRGRALALATNFWNIGAALFAGLALLFAALLEDVALQVRLLFLAALGTALVVGLARIALPESPRWLASRGRIDEARRVVEAYAGAAEASYEAPRGSGVGLGEAVSRYRFRLAVLAVITVAQYVTYGMLAYYLPYAPGFRLEADPASIVFTANLGASVGAFLMIPIIDRYRRLTVLIAFSGGLLTVALVALTHNLALLAPFYAFLFINLVFSEWAWGSLSTLQSELFPTGIRASVVGALTSLTGVAGAIVVYGSTLLTATGFLAAAIALWLAGLAAAASWYLRGVESAGVAVEELV